jgi:hypothetical protein
VEVVVNPAHLEGVEVGGDLGHVSGPPGMVEKSQDIPPHRMVKRVKGPRLEIHDKSSRQAISLVFGAIPAHLFPPCTEPWADQLQKEILLQRNSPIKLIRLEKDEQA